MLLPRALLSCLAALVIAGCSSAPFAAHTPAGSPTQASSSAWKQDMRRVAPEDRLTPPPRGGVVFVGSSSIRLWTTLETDFAGVAVINRGFGGPEIRDSTWHADRIIVAYAPRQVLLYAGDNDLSSRRTPMRLRDELRAFGWRVRRDVPDARIAYIANKPSPARAHLLAAQRDANALIRAEAVRMQVVFIDIFTPLLDAEGRPREDLSAADRLHMNAAGYDLWRRTIAPYLTGK